VFEPGTADRDLWVIDEKADVQAFLVARFSAGECEVENLVVAAQYRRRGFGSQLLQTLIAAARERNVERILLEVRESNEAARALYERFGFGSSGKRKAYYTHPTEDAILLMLQLDCTSSSASKR
jgi:ribosomal-protein-alanine N-acetyltransferase